MNTGAFALRLPDGVTYTSTSGQFIGKPASIVAPARNGVPEPFTSLLLAAGIGVMALTSRIHRSKRTLQAAAFIER